MALPARSLTHHPRAIAPLMLRECIYGAILLDMRTTVRLDPEVAAAAERLRQERRIGLGEAVNELARAGLTRGGEQAARFQQRTASVGLRVDVTNIADALELLDRYDAEDTYREAR